MDAVAAGMRLHVQQECTQHGVVSPCLPGCLLLVMLLQPSAQSSVSMPATMPAPQRPQQEAWRMTLA
jgi:hypothetical protein